MTGKDVQFANTFTPAMGEVVIEGLHSSTTPLFLNFFLFHFRKSDSATTMAPSKREANGATKPSTTVRIKTKISKSTWLLCSRLPGLKKVVIANKAEDDIMF
ncbi:hypothetical protein HBI82_054620 [Parastagonospora nodorum]|nr:hypothetical protein HBH43_116880 [Parastagonospora nodorum]KAH6029448.1 hypothetical protein HBI82_054620 [Parastagonospora nodorum]